MSDSLMEISIVVPVFNSASTIKKTLSACLEQSYPNGRLEVIAVDDGSSDESGKIIKKFPVRYIAHQENSGPARARNTGWRSARGDIVCFTDSDCVPSKDWILRLIAGFRDKKTAAVAGSYDIANSQSLLADCIYEEIRQRHLKMPLFIRAFGSYNVAMRRKVLEELGGFAQDYRYASAEDNDLSYRIISSGYSIYFAKDALVAHHHPESLSHYLKEQYRHGFWRVKLYKQHPQMIAGDDYTSPRDIIEPPFALGLIVLFPVFFFRGSSLIYAACFFFYLILRFPVVVAVCLRRRRLKYSWLAVVTFLRGFARSFGMVKGVFAPGDI